MQVLELIKIIEEGHRQTPPPGLRTQRSLQPRASQGESKTIKFASCFRHTLSLNIITDNPFIQLYPIFKCAKTDHKICFFSNRPKCSLSLATGSYTTESITRRI